VCIGEGKERCGRKSGNPNRGTGGIERPDVSSFLGAGCGDNYQLHGAREVGE